LQNNPNFPGRVEKLVSWLKKENIDAVIIEDSEGRRNTALRYFTGLPSDALLFVFSAGKTILVPWDILLAEKLSFADEVIPYNEFSRLPERAIPEVLRREGLGRDSIVEISGNTPHLLYGDLSEKLKGRVLCRKEGLDRRIQSLRMRKEKEEIEFLQRAAEITDRILDILEEGFRGGAFKSEIDVALTIETEARKMGAESTGFETLVAGSGRSFAIHPYPTYSGASVTAEGFNIVDFGVKFEGYTTDVTFTVFNGNPSAEQKKMIRLVESSYELALSGCVAGTSCREIARRVDEFLKENDLNMPHGLGHGIGLEPHESPFLRNREDSETALEPGMVITLEPGLYHPQWGGVRLENDILITENTPRVLTSSRILSVPLQNR